MREMTPTITFDSSIFAKSVIEKLPVTCNKTSEKHKLNKAYKFNIMIYYNILKSFTRGMCPSTLYIPDLVPTAQFFVAQIPN